MATIYDLNANCITESPQGSMICDAAVITARRIAADRGEAVVLHDDGHFWLISPDGSQTQTTEYELGSWSGWPASVVSREPSMPKP